MKGNVFMDATSRSMIITGVQVMVELLFSLSFADVLILLASCNVVTEKFVDIDCAEIFEF